MTSAADGDAGTPRRASLALGGCIRPHEPRVEVDEAAASAAERVAAHHDGLLDRRVVPQQPRGGCGPARAHCGHLCAVGPDRAVQGCDHVRAYGERKAGE